jgi:signal transduction histidine kinase
MRHTINNALTSMLGNSELLLVEPGLLSAQAREQTETIRMMALRMNEIFQRFSSLETELRYVEKQSGIETRALARSATAST